MVAPSPTPPDAGAPPGYVSLDMEDNDANASAAREPHQPPPEPLPPFHSWTGDDQGYDLHNPSKRAAVQEAAAVLQWPGPPPAWAGTAGGGESVDASLVAAARALARSATDTDTAQQ